jgi:hypothetical protein
MEKRWRLVNSWLNDVGRSGLDSTWNNSSCFFTSNNFVQVFFPKQVFQRDSKNYSDASSSNPHVIFATPMKAMAVKAIKLSEDTNMSTPIRNCTERKVDKEPEIISNMIINLRIEASTSNS